MGKRSSAKKPQTRVKLTLDKTFKCMFCQHNGTITFGRLDCKDCAQHFETDINHLTEPIDIYAEWIDACRAVNPEGARLQHRGQAPAVVRSNPTSTQATNAARGKKRRGSHDDDQEEEEDEDEDDLPNPVGQRKKRRALDEDDAEEEDEQEEDQGLPEPVGKSRVGVPQQVEEEYGDDDEDLPEPQGRKNRPGVVVDDEEDE
ncbi:BZ3500_MvSof-1268-A1-R1_Chr9g10809 [Microbotryum saponariae]|uniref:Transcription elongation factor 1 homolog n=1 Tax=Microbotryum saponariae TaxID=289078 RepID=A0A2X0L2E7_9BASI|nr:BZ3501_MvSof-1269-A2-R1_Chr9g10557 [Microbotryum saponariae]SDA00731.1 BZ3500_MvSof-1268-A1-R1_Chr9g10809 [Microbotryum saponariae]